MRERAIFLDLDNTLYNFSKLDKAGEIACVNYLKSQFGYDGTREDYHREIYDRMHDMEVRLSSDNCAIHSRTLRGELFLRDHGYPVIPHAANLDMLYWTTGLAVLTEEPGIRELLQEIRRRNIYVGIATNMSAYIQYRKIEKLGFSDLVTDIIASEETGFEKPHEGYFRYCLEKADVAPENAIFVGDNIVNDCEGALGVGMRTILYQPPRLPAHPEAAGMGIPVIHDYRDSAVRELMDLN